MKARASLLPRESDDQEEVILGLDEVGKCLPLVRGLVSDRFIHIELAKALGFRRVHLYFAGTGTDVFVFTETDTGSLLPSTDPSKLRIVTLRPLDDPSATADFAIKLLAPIADFRTLPRQSDLLDLFTNPRLALQFAVALERNKLGDGEIPSQLEVITCMQQALRMFAKLNGLADLTNRHKLLLMDVLYHTLVLPRDGEKLALPRQLGSGVWIPLPIPSFGIDGRSKPVPPGAVCNKTLKLLRR